MATSRAGSLESLRERNRLLVVEVLLRHGSSSRADISRQTGLSRSTVSSLVGDLQAEGLVRERPADGAPKRRTRPEGGRPGVLLTLDRSAGALVGMDFGHDHVRIAVADLGFTVLGEREQRMEVDQEARQSLDVAAELAHGLLDELGLDLGRVLGAGMGLSGPIDRDTGLIRSQPILPSWAELDAAEEMRRRLGIPVHLDNDANVGALGECTFGAGRDHRVVAYVRLSAGIGLGLIFDGRPFRGAHGIAGELGHVLVDPNGPICRCGNRGCLETLVSGPALCEQLRRSHGEMDVAQLLALAAEGDLGARRVVQDAARVVGRALADLCNYINPDAVVIGGELARAGELLLEPLRDAVDRYAIPAAAGGVSIVPGVLDDRAELLGALALAGQESQDAIAVRGPQLSTHMRRST